MGTPTLQKSRRSQRSPVNWHGSGVLGRVIEISANCSVNKRRVKLGEQHARVVINILWMSCKDDVNVLYL